MATKSENPYPTVEEWVDREVEKLLPTITAERWEEIQLLLEEV